MFDRRQALKLAKLSHAAYGSSTYSKVNNSVLLIESADSQSFSFRGSNDLGDVADDIAFFQFKRKRFGNAKIHNGFADAWEDLRPFVMKTANKNKKIFLTGHSLGAAIATLCAVELKAAGYNLQPVYTYGQPRIGNSDWEKYFNSQAVLLFRIINGIDFATRMPKLFYEHVGFPVYFHEGKMVPTPPTSFTLFFWRKGQDHQIANYVKTLEKAQKL